MAVSSKGLDMKKALRSGMMKPRIDVGLEGAATNVPAFVRTVLHGDDARTGQGNDLHSALHGRDSGYRDGQGAVNSGRARNGGLVGLLTGAVSELSTTFTQPNTQLGQNQRSRDPFESSMRPSDAPLPGQSAQYSGQVHDADAEEMYYMNSWHTPFIPD